MAYQVTRTIRKNGRSYTYTFWQESYRENGKVKTRHLGRGKQPRYSLGFVPENERGLNYIEHQMEQYPSDDGVVKEKLKEPKLSAEDRLVLAGARLQDERLKDRVRTAQVAFVFKERTGLTLPTTASATPIEKSTPRADLRDSLTSKAVGKSAEKAEAPAKEASQSEKE